MGDPRRPGHPLHVGRPRRPPGRVGGLDQRRGRRARAALTSVDLVGECVRCLDEVREHHDVSSAEVYFEPGAPALTPTDDEDEEVEDLFVIGERDTINIETQLRDAGEIATDFGQTLSWQYLSWVREHPLNWHTPTAILYAGHDNLTSRDTITAFANAHQASLSVYEPGEHWFHTPDQLDAMTRWEKSEI